MLTAPDPGRVKALLASYPRTRPVLPDAYRQIYEREYLLNRHGGTRATKLAMRAEAWMHRTVAARGIAGSVLELGAGTLNHLPYEPRVDAYDVVEPLEWFYADSPDRRRVGQIFRQIEDVPVTSSYDRVISIAVLEHLADLPRVIARCALLLAPGGLAQHAIPSEGGLAWGLGWRLTTGVAYRVRNRLSYGVAMRHEHLNEAWEIELLLEWFFEQVSVTRFPLPFLHGSLYTYFEGRQPRRDRCLECLAPPLR
jgi:SAM-dependent methyltransferase